MWITSVADGQTDRITIALACMRQTTRAKTSAKPTQLFIIFAVFVIFHVAVKYFDF